MDLKFDALNNITGTKPEVRYIKLGPNNCWARDAFRRGELPFSFREVPHELALTRDENAITAHLVAQGKAAGAARNAARQVCTFYSLDETAIWITFADGLMWCTSAEPEVIWLGESGDYAPRMRKATGWSSANRFDVPFVMSGLSSRLTKVASAQATICRVEAEDYVLRKIWSVREPAVLQAEDAQQAVMAAIDELIRHLHWSDFETLIDILLARGGWSRVSDLGGNMKDADMLVEQAITGELAIIQVKSASNQTELQHYLDVYDNNPGWSLLIYACHSPSGTLSAPNRPDVRIWARAELSRMVLRYGMFDWLVARVG